MLLEHSLTTMVNSLAIYFFVSHEIKESQRVSVQRWGPVALLEFHEIS